MFRGLGHLIILKVAVNVLREDAAGRCVLLSCRMERTKNTCLRYCINHLVSSLAHYIQLPFVGSKGGHEFLVKMLGAAEALFCTIRLRDTSQLCT